MAVEYKSLGTIRVPESWNLSSDEILVLSKKLECSVVTLLPDGKVLNTIREEAELQPPIIDLARQTNAARQAKPGPKKSKG